MTQSQCLVGWNWLYAELCRGSQEVCVHENQEAGSWEPDVFLVEVVIHFHEALY
jgi:hypothetical protein